MATTPAGVEILYGRAGAAREVAVSEAQWGNIAPPADALVDGRLAWRPETVARVKAEREARRTSGRGHRAS